MVLELPYLIMHASGVSVPRKTEVKNGQQVNLKCTPSIKTNNLSLLLFVVVVVVVVVAVCCCLLLLLLLLLLFLLLL